MLLLVGLGNPGARYAGHRHNIGFMAVDAIAARHGFSKASERFDGVMARGDVGAHESVIFKPMTSMNLCGPSVARLIRHFRLPPEEAVIFHDEVDLPLGKVRLKQGGGYAGHNGLRSLGAHIEGGFRRARLGIGHPGHASLMHRHVLGNFTPQEKKQLSLLFDSIADAVPLLAEHKDSHFASRVHEAMEEAPPHGV